jgi:N-acyl-D-aspartate/D-glutamate deacylase
MLDMIIRGARIADGSGAPLYEADIGISDGRIAALGTVDDAARRIIDGAGLVACPGFIDVHTHYDAQLFWDPQVSPSCFHGVTTAFAGHCGFSIAPLNEASSSYLLHMLARVEGIPAETLKAGVPWNWSSFAEYLGRLEGNVGINIGVMAGHSAIRHVVMGERSLHEQASDEDLRRMKALLADCLAAGAMGFSTTISPSHCDADGHPVPSRQSSREELIELAGVLRAYPGTSLEMTPTVGAFDAEHKRLMADMSVAAQRPLNWNLLAPAVDDPDEFVEGQLNATDLARGMGGEVICLTAGQPILLRVNLHGGFIFDIFEGWGKAFQLPVEQRIAFFADPERRDHLDRAAKKATAKSLSQLAQWENLIVESVVSEALAPNVGLSIGEIARRDGKKPIDAMLDLAVAER